MIDQENTLTTPIAALASRAVPLLCMTIVWHPQRERIGQQALGPAGPGELILNRFLPLFQHPLQSGEGLGHRCIARAPLRIVRGAGDSVCIAVPDSRMVVAHRARPLDQDLHFTAAEVARGVILELGGMILVCVHWMHVLPRDNRLPGLLGVSSAAITLRDQVRQVARTMLPVLLLGETGTGKDVAARAIHAASARAGGPFVAFNMAALNESLAAADLFGAQRGAYTGAHSARPGLFAEAAGGTLFLDEIGDTPATVQPMLLRVLEDGSYRPLGADRDARADVRLVCATDQDLEQRRFNPALGHRLQGFVITLAPLRERREDIGVLLRALLAGQAVELPLACIAELCNADWPGNIRQLAQVLRRALMAVEAGTLPLLADFMPAAAPVPASGEDAPVQPEALGARHQRGYASAYGRAGAAPASCATESGGGDRSPRGGRLANSGCCGAAGHLPSVAVQTDRSAPADPSGARDSAR